MNKDPTAKSLPSPTNIFPGNRLQPSGAPAVAATVTGQAQPEGLAEAGAVAGRVAVQRQPNGVMSFSGGDVSGPVSYASSAGNPLVAAVERVTTSASAGDERGFVNPSIEPEVRGPAGGNPMTNWGRTGISNAQVAQANPAGRVSMQRQPNGTTAFSGGDVSGPVSYIDDGGNPLVGGGIRGNGFSRVDSTPEGANVAMGPNGSFANASGNPIANAAAGQTAPAIGAATEIANSVSASPAASGAVDAALTAAAARGDFDAVRAHYAGRGQAMGAQVAAQGSGVPAFEAPTVRHSGNDWAARNNLRNLEVSASSITNRLDWGRTGRGQISPAVAAYQQALQADLAAQGKAPELQLKTSEINAGLQRAAMSEQGENYRAAGRNAIAAAGQAQRIQEDSRAAADRATQLDFSRQRLALEKERAGQAGVPQGYRRTADGRGLEAIAGGPADVSSRGVLNDTQSKALMFGSRMLQSGQALDQLAEQGATQPGYIKRMADMVGAGALANWTQSPGQQQVEQSQRDFVNAVLRRESGAAISNQEFDNARKQYFPQPGDSEAVIAQKRQNRELSTRGMLAEVPGQQNRVQQVLGAAGQQQGAAQPQQRQVVRTGTANGRKVLQYSDGSIGYAD